MREALCPSSSSMRGQSNRTSGGRGREERRSGARERELDDLGPCPALDLDRGAELGLASHDREGDRAEGGGDARGAERADLPLAEARGRRRARRARSAAARAAAGSACRGSAAGRPAPGRCSSPSRSRPRARRCPPRPASSRAQARGRSGGARTRRGGSRRPRRSPPRRRRSRSFSRSASACSARVIRSTPEVGGDREHLDPVPVAVALRVLGAEPLEAGDASARRARSAR